MIYLSHSTDFDFENELYKPLNTQKDLKFFFPHIGKERNSKKIIKKCDLFIAEVSVPSHGVGIEIGWAETFGIPIVFIHRKGRKVSSSLKFVSSKIIEYENIEDIIPKIKRMIK